MFNLELQDITVNVKSDDANKDILNHINVKFDSQKITAITGHNGSGKSTLTKVIMGIVESDAGKVLLNGVDITSLPIYERAKQISYAFQSPIKFKGITVKDLFKAMNIKDFNIMCENLSLVGLCARDYIDRDFNDELSGGELKRIELALAISRSAEFYIFDEPEAGIDLWSFENIIKIFNNLKSKGCGVIVVTHQKKILEVADNILMLDGGNVEYYGETKGVLKNLNKSKCKKLAEDENE